MIKEIFAGIKIVLALIAGVLGLLGLRYTTILVRDITSPLCSLLQILIWVALIIGAIALWCDYYLAQNKCIYSGNCKKEHKIEQDTDRGFDNPRKGKPICPCRDYTEKK